MVVGHRLLRAVFIAAGFLITTTSFAPAAVLTRQFTGTVTSVDATGAALGISLGDPISGSFTWDTASLTTTPPTSIAFQTHRTGFPFPTPIAPNSLNVTIGSYVVPNLTSEVFAVVVGNNTTILTPPHLVPEDSVGVSRYVNMTSPGQLSGIRVFFHDTDLTTLTGADEPTEEEMDKFSLGLFELYTNSTFTPGAVIGSIQLTPVPEPATCVMALSVFVVLFGCAARKKPA